MALVLANRVFYTYAHYTPQGNLFYIGKGSGRRAGAEVSRNKHWRSIVAKHGKPEVQILAHWKTEQEALEHEKFLILCFRKTKHKLCNMTDGGEGTSGIKLTEEHKQKISLALKGRVGVKPSVETLKKLRTSHLGIQTWNKGLTNLPQQSKETIAKRTQKLLGHTHNAVYMYIGTNRTDLNLVTFIGNRAMLSAGFDPARIRNCADGKRKTHKNYFWRKEPIGKQ